MKFPKTTMTPVWLALPAVLTLVYVCTLVEFPVDFWHRAASGRLMWQTGGLVDHDTFTFTIAGRPIVNQNWLAELGLFGLLQAGGFPLAEFAAGLCYAATIGIVTWLAWRRGGNARTAAALGLVALALSASNLGVRTQAIAAVLFAVELAALWTWPDRWPTVAVVAAVELAWTNVHGTFPLGVILPGIFFAGSGLTAWRVAGLRAAWTDRAARCCLIAAVVAAAAMFANPHPEKTFDYILGVTSTSAARGIEEWMPTSLATYAGAAFVVSVLAVILVLPLARKRLTATEVLLLVAFALLACRAQRMVMWWALAMPTAVAPALSALVARWRKTPFQQEERSTASAVVLLVLAALAFLSTPWTRAYNPLLPPAKRAALASDEPAAAVQFLEQSGLDGNLLGPMEWGGYLSWHLDGPIKIFIDPRIDFYGDDVWNDYARIAQAAPGWQETLDRRGVDLIVWRRQPLQKLPDALVHSSQWKTVHQDETAIVFIRCPNHP